MVASQDQFIISPTSKRSENNSDHDPEINAILVHPTSHPSQLQSTSDVCSSSGTSSPENMPAAIEININFHDNPGCTGCGKLSCADSKACSENDMLRREDPKEAKGEAKLLSLPSLRTEFIEWNANGELKWKEIEETGDFACSSANTLCKSSSPFQLCLHFAMSTFLHFPYLYVFFFFFAFLYNKRTDSVFLLFN
jgi:hypothetical protein